jgi:hypothetical protein
VETRVTLPPRAQVATALLGLVVPRPDVEAIIGDLEEEAGPSRWYWTQIVRSILPLLWLLISRGGCRSTFAVALGACATQGLVELTTGFAVHEMSPASARWPAVLALFLTLISLAVVSYTAATIRAGAAIALAGIAVAAITLRLALTAYAGGEVSLVALVAVVVVPATAFAGGSVSLRARR